MNVIDRASLELVRGALAEDLAGYGDITTRWTVSPDLAGRAVIEAREALVVCGLPLAAAVMDEVDAEVIFTPLVEDGAAAALTVHVEDVAVGDGEVFAAGELYGEHLCGERILREETCQKGFELRRIFKERL